MSYKIDKNIPMPNGYSDGRYKSIYSQALAGMEKGDSIVVNIFKAQAFRYAARNVKCKITTRKINDEEIRIWMVEPAPDKENK